MEGRKATAQWSEHLREEERERKQRFDRAHLEQHEAVLSALEKARARYDSARTKARVKEAQTAFHAALPALEKKVSAVDPDRQSSNLLEDYAAILAALDGPYPAARLSALDGDLKASTELAGDIEKRLAKARAWLAEEDREERE